MQWLSNPAQARSPPARLPPQKHQSLSPPPQKTHTHKHTHGTRAHTHTSHTRVHTTLRLNKVVMEVATERSQRFQDRDLEVLVEGVNPKNPAQAFGRSRHNKLVRCLRLCFGCVRCGCILQPVVCYLPCAYCPALHSWAAGVL